MLIGAYAPHSGRPIEEREGFYTALTEAVEAIPYNHEIIIAGDLKLKCTISRKTQRGNIRLSPTRIWTRTRLYGKV